ncbi:MAG: hypothetical protein Kow0062_17690 [Acidobacteriota bacterium]
MGIRRHSAPALLAALLVVSGSGLAADGAAARLSGGVRAALRHAPELALARSGLDAARAGHDAASRPGLPWLELQSEGLDGLSGRAANATDYVRSGVPVWSSGQARAARELREQARAWTGAAATVAARETTLAVLTAFADMARAIELAAIHRRRDERMRRAVEIARARLDAGEMSGLEVLQLEIAAARLGAERATAEGERGTAAARLARLGVPDEFRPQPGDLAQLAAIARGLPEPAEDAAASRLGQAADVVALERETALESASSRHAARAARGPLELEAEWERVPSVDGVPGFDALGVRLRIPLGAGAAAAAQRAHDAAGQAAAGARRAARLAALRADLAALIATERAARRRLEALEDHGSTMARIAAALEAQFRLGEVDYLELIAGLDLVEEFEYERVAARHALLIARGKIALTVGPEDEREALGLVAGDTR